VNVAGSQNGFVEGQLKLLVHWTHWNLTWSQMGVAVLAHVVPVQPTHAPAAGKQRPVVHAGPLSSHCEQTPGAPSSQLGAEDGQVLVGDPFTQLVTHQPAVPQT
jgi:hypothetical protein